MKKLEKMSLANVKGKLSREEMKTIMAGSGSRAGVGSFVWDYTIGKVIDWTIGAMYDDYQRNYTSGKPATTSTDKYAQRGPY